MHKSLLFLLSIFCLISFSKANDTIIWNTAHYPPSLIAEGKYRNQGFSDMSRDMFMFNLKDYEHEIISGSIQNAMLNLGSNKNFCFVGLSRNKEKEEFIQYSKPFIEILPNELIIRTKDLKKFKSYIGMKSSVNLHRLLQNNGFKFGYVKHRSYTKNIDRLILINDDKKHLILRDTENNYQGLVRPLSEESFDYIIEYPTVISYVKNELEIDEEFSKFFIMDSSALIKLYVGCSKNEFGKDVINKVNKIIKKNKTMFIHFYKTWLDYDSKKQYEKLIN